MIFTNVTAALFVVMAAFNPDASPEAAASKRLSPQEKAVVFRPMESGATECIARTVSADPRFSPVAAGESVNELIVDSVPTCLDAVRTMIDTYDRLFGNGSGELFFSGPYLDSLPEAVEKLVRRPASQP